MYSAATAKRFSRRMPVLSAAASGAQRAITACRTGSLGGHVEQCHAHRLQFLSSRHYSKCQDSARAQLLAERQAELLPVPYFHVIFTIRPP